MKETETETEKKWYTERDSDRARDKRKWLREGAGEEDRNRDSEIVRCMYILYMYKSQPISTFKIWYSWNVFVFINCNSFRSKQLFFIILSCIQFQLSDFYVLKVEKKMSLRSKLNT